MKDKRTYTNAKEHGEDMSHENEAKITIAPNYKDDNSLGETLPYLIEKHKKEIWDWKQKESEWVKTKNLADGYKKVIEELSSKLVEQERYIKNLQQEIEKLVEEKNK